MTSSGSKKGTVYHEFQASLIHPPHFQNRYKPFLGTEEGRGSKQSDGMSDTIFDWGHL